ncbi:MAG TPA: response regulator transcription factor [Candidatus Acidoferrum sp.]|jgi:DNA-binding NarL/FixJ family response regulator
MTRILIADDHAGTREILRVLLHQHPGWEVCGEAGNNSEALKKAIALKPDVLVKDWVMPGMDGVELTRQLAKAAPDTAIVIFSFYDLPELQSIAKAAGVHGVASKDLSSLISAIEEVLRSARNKSASVVDVSPSSPSAQPEDLD